jgi:dUTP pyrophosphatase
MSQKNSIGEVKMSEVSTGEVKMKEKVLSTKIKLIDKKAVLPSKAHESDSGWDLSVIGIHKIEGDTVFFKTGLQIKPPAGHYFEVYPRSSISALPCMLANSVGIIDESYRGELIVPIRILHPGVGISSERDTYPGGMIKALDARPTSINEVANLIIGKKPKIAQMILRKRINTSFEEISSLDETERGEGGFGSSDSKQKKLPDQEVKS